MNALTKTAPTPPVTVEAPRFPALTYGHDAYGTDRFWIGPGPADSHIAHVRYVVPYIKPRTLSGGIEGPADAEGWAKLFAQAPETIDALKTLYAAFLSRHGCFPLDRVNDETRLWNDAMSKANATLKKAGLL